MKTLIMIAAVLVSTSALAQIQTIESPKETTIGKIKMAGTVWFELTYTTEGTDTMYRFTAIDSRYQYLTQYKTISFDGSDNTLNTFYTILKSFFIDKNRKDKDYTKQFQLGKSLITAKVYNSGFGIKSVFLLIDDATTIMSEKQIDKVFGKR